MADKLTDRALGLLSDETSSRALHDAAKADDPLLPILRELEREARFRLIATFDTVDPPTSLSGLRREVAAWKRSLPDARRKHEEVYGGRPIAMRGTPHESPEFVDAALLALELARRGIGRLRSNPQRAALDAHLAANVLATADRAREDAEQHHLDQVKRSLGGMMGATSEEYLKKVAREVRDYEKKYGPASNTKIGEKIAAAFDQSPRNMRRLIARARPFIASGQLL
jgi:hypothetical protein